MSIELEYTSSSMGPAVRVPEAAASSSGHFHQQDELNILWESYCESARNSLSGDGLLPYDDGDDRLLSSWPSPPLLKSERGEAQMQMEYTGILEAELRVKQTFDQRQQLRLEHESDTVDLSSWPHIAGGGIEPPNICYEPSEALRLRRENRVLKAKASLLERQLKEVHTRCRRAEQTNTRWRSHMAAMRKKEAEEAERMREIAGKAARSGEAERENKKLREATKQRDAELLDANRRCAELERACTGLQEALSQAMGSYRSLSDAGPPDSHDLVERALALTLLAR